MDDLSPALPRIAAATCIISEFTGLGVKMLLMCAHEKGKAYQSKKPTYEGEGLLMGIHGQCISTIQTCLGKWLLMCAHEQAQPGITS